MPYPQLDRHALKIKPLTARHNKLSLDRDLVALDQPPSGLSADARAATADIAVRIRAARKVLVNGSIGLACAASDQNR